MLELSGGEVVLRIGLAMLLGGLVGFEREVRAQPAGFRTMALVGMGAALFGLLSVHAFADYVRPREETNVGIDVTRIASQVVVGVGFLGGGAILKHGASIRGLTTAASMWVTAAIGLAAGMGYYLGAVATTVAALVTLVLLRGLRSVVRARLARSTDVLTVRLAPGADPSSVITALRRSEGVELRELHVEVAPEDGQTVVLARIKRSAATDRDDLVGRLSERDDVDEIWAGR